MRQYIERFIIGDNINLFDGFFLGGSLGAAFGVVFNKMIIFVVLGFIIGISTQLIFNNKHILIKKLSK